MDSVWWGVPCQTSALPCSLSVGFRQAGMHSCSPLSDRVWAPGELQPEMHRWCAGGAGCPHGLARPGQPCSSSSSWVAALHPITALCAQGTQFCSLGMAGANRALCRAAGAAARAGSPIDSCVLLAAGRTTTSEELEDMLESGNPAIFSSGVSTAGQPCCQPAATPATLPGGVFWWPCPKHCPAMGTWEHAKCCWGLAAPSCLPQELLSFPTLPSPLLVPHPSSEGLR